MLKHGIIGLSLAALMTGCTSLTQFEREAAKDPSIPMVVKRQGAAPAYSLDWARFHFAIANPTNKIIKYYTISASSYNQVGDYLATNEAKITGPIQAQWSQPEWLRHAAVGFFRGQDVFCSKVNWIRVEFMDGEIVTLRGEDVEKALAPAARGCQVWFG